MGAYAMTDKKAPAWGGGQGWGEREYFSPSFSILTEKPPFVKSAIRPYAVILNYSLRVAARNGWRDVHAALTALVERRDGTQ